MPPEMKNITYDEFVNFDKDTEELLEIYWWICL